MPNHYSVNNAAADIIEKIVLPQADALDIGVVKLKNGATVLDFGVHSKAGFRAGKYFTEICMGGLGKLTYGSMRLKEHLVPTVRVFTKAPSICVMASHAAYWKVPYRGGRVVISGPVRSVRQQDEFSAAVDYRDDSPRAAVGCIQTEELPDEELLELISEGCGIPCDRLYLLAARTGCVSGAVQVCARNVEQTVPTLFDRGFPMEYIVEGSATTPVVSVVDDEQIAYGRVNDCLIYGQEANIYVRCADEEITRMLPDIPFSKNDDTVYGVPFFDLFKQCGRSWANVPRDWDAPCKVNLINIKTGSVFAAGHLGIDVLERSFMGEGGVV